MNNMFVKKSKLNKRQILTDEEKILVVVSLIAASVIIALVFKHFGLCTALVGL